MIFLLCAAACVTFALGRAAAQSDREGVFAEKCAICHANPATRAPTRDALRAMSPDVILEALTDGVMKEQGIDAVAGTAGGPRGIFDRPKTRD